MKRALLGLWHRTLRHAGPLGITGVALLMAALLLASAIPALQRQGQALRVAVAAKSATPMPAAVRIARRMPVGEQVGQFVAAFPLLSQSPSDLDAVFQSAKRHNVQLPRGEYQLKQDASAPLLIYTATFAVRTNYGAIKDFTADVLEALPNASMDELRMNRSASGSSELESVIRFSFIYRKP